jgi:hypothetical protein
MRRLNVRERGRERGRGYNKELMKVLKREMSLFGDLFLINQRSQTTCYKLKK